MQTQGKIPGRGNNVGYLPAISLGRVTVKATSSVLFVTYQGGGTREIRKCVDDVGITKAWMNGEVRVLSRTKKKAALQSGDKEP